jgi:hypothetical protein
VLINGSASIQPDSGAPSPDADSVAIVFPQGAAPTQKIDIGGLRPRDNPPGESHVAVRAIESLEGAYARADKTGAFSFVLRPGEYWVLVLSRHTVRGANEKPKPGDLDLLGQYFTRPADLIGKAQYHFTLRKIAADTSLDFNFRPGR